MKSRDFRIIALLMLALALALGLGYAVPTLASNGGTVTIKFLDALGNLISGGTLTLTAIAPEGYKFHHWEDADGNPIGTDPTLELTMDGDKRVKAVFVKQATATATPTETPTETPTSTPTPSPVGEGIYENADPALVDVGSWNTAYSGSASGGSWAYTNQAGATVSMTFEVSGSVVKWVTLLGPGRGEADVYIDGAFIERVSNLGSLQWQYEREYTVAPGLHSILIEVVGNGRIDFDAFKVEESSTPTATPTSTATPIPTSTLTPFISGCVWNDEDSDGVQNEGEGGIDGVTLDLYRDNNGDGVIDAGDTLLRTQTTAGDGAYLFTDLLPGDYIVDVTDTGGVLAGYEITTDNDPLALSLGDGEEYGGADFGYVYVGGPAGIYTVYLPIVSKKP